MEFEKFSSIRLASNVSLIVPDVLIFVSSSSCNSLFFWSYSRFSSFSVCFLAQHSAFGIPINRKRKQSSKNEAKKDLVTVHELPYRDIVKSAPIRLASGGLTVRYLKEEFLLIHFKESKPNALQKMQGFKSSRFFLQI